MLSLTVFGTGVIALKSSRDHSSLVGTRYELHRSQRDCLVHYVESRSSKPHDHLSRLAIFITLSFLLRPIALVLMLLRVLNAPVHSIQVIHLYRKKGQRIVSLGGQKSTPNIWRESFKVNWPLFHVSQTISQIYDLAYLCIRRSPRFVQLMALPLDRCRLLRWSPTPDSNRILLGSDPP